ncbi:unnamed protein product [Rotaria sordida]|uniref:Uncharacterized protein n=1 Tax=Rotaria sordida TaxID=392033 RepID=A0A813VLY3_9BILA|nr:unnamed protein product [Rotaria sordida]
MSNHKPKGEKRKSHENLSDISIDHGFVAPYEICANSLNLFQFLISGYLFDHRSFTSLYNQSLKNEWKEIFINERERLKRIKPNENSVIKCFLLNRLLHQYEQNPHGFVQQTKCLHDEIKLRMRSHFPKWESEDLFREVRYWQDIQNRRHLFHFNYKEEEHMPNLPTLLMLQKAMTNWCQFLIRHCQTNVSFLNNGGNNLFIKLIEHSFIIVVQPTGPDGVPVTHYKTDKFGQSAKLNARIVCLLDSDVLQNSVRLSNIDVTLCSLNQDVNDKGLKQTPIVWQTQHITSAEGESVSIFYTDVQNLTVKKTYSRRCSGLLYSNLCQLKFRIKVKIIFHLSDGTNSMFEHDIELLSQPFGISSHSQHSPNIIAKIFLYEIEHILEKERKVINPDILTEYTHRYHTRMLGVKTKEHTIQFIHEVFSKAFNDIENRMTTMNLKSLIEKRLTQFISQIKVFVDYPILTIILFLGICNKTKVDKSLLGTPEEPQMLLRFNDLWNHQYNESPEVRCIIHNGKLTKASISRKAFIDEMCIFIYESTIEAVKQTVIFSYSGGHVFCDFQCYYNEAIFVLSKMKPPGTNDYQPLIPILWKTMPQHNTEEIFQSQSNSLSTDLLYPSNSNLTNDRLLIACTANQQDLQNNATILNFKVTIPVAANINPDPIVHYLEEKFRELLEVQNKNFSETQSIQSLQAITPSFHIIDADMDQDMHLSVNEFDNDQNRELQTPILQTDSLFDLLNDDSLPS